MSDYLRLLRFVDNLDQYETAKLLKLCILALPDSTIAEVLDDALTAELKCELRDEWWE